MALFKFTTMILILLAVLALSACYSTDPLPSIKAVIAEVSSMSRDGKFLELELSSGTRETYRTAPSTMGHQDFKNLEIGKTYFFYVYVLYANHIIVGYQFTQ